MDIFSSLAKLVESKALEILEGEAQTSDSQTLDFTDFEISQISAAKLQRKILGSKFELPSFNFVK